MVKRTPVIMIRSLKAERGGITRAAITRANAFAEKFDEVIIVTFLYQQYHKKIIADLKEKRLLSKKVKVLNFFEDTKPNIKRRGESRDTQKNLIKEKGLVEFPDKRYKEEPSYRYYENGIYIKYKRFTEDGQLKFIDYMDSNRYRIKREEFNEQGLLVRTRHMDYLCNKSRMDRYFDDAGNCYMSVWLNAETGDEERTLTFSGKPNEYKNLYKCQTMWLEKTLNNIAFPTIMCEQRTLDKMLREVKHYNIKRVSVVHANHLEKPFNNIFDIKKSYTNLFKNGNKFDKIILLTKEQKKDVEKAYKDLKNICVIPHPCEQINELAKDRHKVNCNPNLAVTLARFHKDKRLDEAIHAFKFVVNQIPEAKYYIYGYGELKKELQELIDKLNLNENVYLKDYTLNQKEVYQSAACSILTSRQEGFGMVITESMAVGTPVVSYDTKYGPKDIIEDGVDGYVVEQGNKEQLAEKIIKIMQDKKLREILSENALKVKKTFSEKKYKNSWFDLI
ncbi:glycosyltransferase [Virgibacillus dakarensis]|uniref:glycosyltransferase n=1 Tax=Virgibacillus dakarensis TaxID=1917889 RepID=UPI000B44064C|nr:glycosyltransferase [Virgibacillus dakarensis]MBT2218049.1 glycosyltransferase [Virgibacillus dakarensis]